MLAHHDLVTTLPQGGKGVRKINTSTWVIVMSVFRASCFFLALSGLMMATGVWAQTQDPLAARIAELERTIVQYESAARTAKSDKAKDMEYLLALVTLSTLYMQADRIQDSWPLSEKMLAKAEAVFGADNPVIVTQIEALAAVYGLQGRFAEAEKLRKRAIVLNENAFGPDSANVATSLQGMANLFRLQEKYDEALVFATRALGIAERKLAAGDPQRAIFLSQVADIHMSAKRFEQAEPLLKQALAIVEKTGGVNAAVSGMQTIQYLQSIGLAYHGRGLNAQARPYIDRAIEMSVRLFGPGHTATGAMLMTLAIQLFDQGQLDDAERLYRQALPISEKNGKLHATLADNYAGLGLVEFKRKNWRNAYTMLLKGSTIAAGLEQIAGAGGIAELEKRVTIGADVFLINAVAAYRTAQAEPAEEAVLREEAFRLAQRAERSQTAGALAQMAARVSTGSGPLGRLVRERQDLAREWQGLDKRLEQALVSGTAERNATDENSARVRMAALSTKLGEIDVTIAKDFPSFAKLSDPAPLSIREVQALLGPDEVMIFIANRLNQSLIWAIGRDTVAWELAQVGEEELMREVSALRCGLDETAWSAEGSNRCADATGRRWSRGAMLPFDLQRAHKLYSTLLAPFEGMTRDRHLIVATSGPLALLPLHVFVTEPPAAAFPEDAKGYAGVGWLAKRNAMSVLPSVASLKTLRDSTGGSRAKQPFIGIANPLFVGPDARYAELARLAKANRTCAATAQNAGSVRDGSRAPALAPALKPGGLAPAGVIAMQAPLPETAEEVCTVGRGLGASERDIYLAERATETQIKQISASGELAKYQIVHFATHGALAGQVSKTAEAGLLLSPPATSTALDDGYLSATEIAALKLDADWVILSACNTAGAGRAGAEALSGMVRAFFYAQARAVLASHWEVESEATVKLITVAVLAIRNDRKIGRADALRRAMVSLIDDPASAHPKVWAPFVLAGEGGRAR